jgi:hypothetical protein
VRSSRVSGLPALSPETARANHEVFRDLQREDGYLPCNVKKVWEGARSRWRFLNRTAEVPGQLVGYALACPRCRVAERRRASFARQVGKLNIAS